jgi:hypothetical protein
MGNGRETEFRIQNGVVAQLKVRRGWFESVRGLETRIAEGEGVAMLYV